MKKLPAPIVSSRKSMCSNCSCSVDFDSPCSVCPNGLWGREFCNDQEKPQLPRVKSQRKPPNVISMAKTFAKSSADWAANGFKHTEEGELAQRIETCRSCENWDAKAFNETGRCLVCGCSTWAKLRMATEKCPIGKW